MWKFYVLCQENTPKVSCNFLAQYTRYYTVATSQVDTRTYDNIFSGLYKMPGSNYHTKFKTWAVDVHFMSVL